MATREGASVLRLPIVATAALALGAGLANAQQYSRMEVEASYWEPDVSGSLRVIEQGVGGDIDLNGDLALESDAVTDLRLVFRPSRRTEIRFTRLPLSFSGDAVVNRTLEFAGVVFAISTRVVSELELDYLRAGFAWQFLSSSDGRFRAGPLLEVKAYEGDASLFAPDLSLPMPVREDFDAAFGSAGIAVDLEPTDRIHLFGEVSAVVGSDEGDQTDLEVGVRVKLAGPLAVQAGYRSIDSTFDLDNDSVDFDVDGVFFGASLRF